MSDNTAIEWADTTWNPVIGCDKVSPGCGLPRPGTDDQETGQTGGCYAITSARIRSGNPHPAVAAAFEGVVDRIDGRLDWTGRVNLLEGRLEQPLHWRDPRKVFVNSLSDLFHKGVPDEFIARVFAVMALTQQHTYQVLTKRHGRMRSLLSNHGFWGAVGLAALEMRDVWLPAVGVSLDAHALPNVWLGVSVEDQQHADLRIPALLDTPAAVRWLSCEPLLGPVDLTRISRPSGQQPEMVWDVLGQRYGVPGRWQVPLNVPRIDWVVAGGESGPGARPMHPDWARLLRDQCAAAGVPFFFKQWGSWVPESMWVHRKSAPAAFLDIDGRVRRLVNGKPVKVPMARGEAITVRQVGKKAAGRRLDGRTHLEFPAVARV